MIINKVITIVLLFISSTASASCDAPAPAFPLPNISRTKHGAALKATSERIISEIKDFISLPIYNTTSFSVEVTSQTESLFDFQHTARERSELFGGGAKRTDGDTRYRIASITKSFTTLALLQLEKAGNLSLDDPVLKHLPNLVKGQSGSLPWKDITLRALLSQQSGIPRDFAQDDFVNDPNISAALGLPKLDREKLDLPQCDAMVNYTRACNETDFLTYIKTLEPVFAPNQHSSYSNINFDLLGVIIAKVTGSSYEDYITHHVLKPINMTQTTFTTPPNNTAAIPKGTEYYWPFYIGIQNPTGGLYSSSSDLSKWIRYILTSYNAQTPALNWFTPTSFGGSIQTFYGVPWEIFRAKVGEIVGETTATFSSSSKRLDLSKSTRPVTIITKSGGLPGYTSIIIILPDYGLGISILVAGDSPALSHLRDITLREMVRVAEHIALDELASKYVGTYSHQGKTSHSETASSGNSRIILASSPTKGLHVHQWLSNGTDTIAALHTLWLGGPEVGNLTLHVVPTLLFVDEENQKGGRWRIIPTIVRPREHGGGSVWDNFCIGDWDLFQYGGRSFNELVFWMGEDGEGEERVRWVEAPAFRMKLGRVDGGEVEGLGGKVLVEQA